MRQQAVAALAIFTLSYSALWRGLAGQNIRSADVGLDTTPERISIIRRVNLAGRKLVSAHPAPQANSILPRDMISHPELAVTQ